MDVLAAHRTTLEQWRTSMNLVGPGPLDEHYLDSTEALRPLAKASGRWADMGTGAGFPGVVFAARFPEVRLDLVDSRRKRCAFLAHVLGQVEASNVSVKCARVEDLEAAAYDGVTARAFAPPAEVLAHAARLLKPGGLVVLMVGWEAVVTEGERFEPVFDHTYAIGERRHRSVGLALR